MNIMNNSRHATFRDQSDALDFAWITRYTHYAQQYYAIQLLKTEQIKMVCLVPHDIKTQRPRSMTSRNVRNDEPVKKVR